MLIRSASDISVLEEMIRKNLKCETNFCSIIKSVPYRLLRNRLLRHFEGQLMTDEEKIYFNAYAFMLRVFPSATVIVVELRWTDIYVHEEEDGDAYQDQMFCEGVRGQENVSREFCWVGGSEQHRLE